MLSTNWPAACVDRRCRLTDVNKPEAGSTRPPSLRSSLPGLSLPLLRAVAQEPHRFTAGRQQRGAADLGQGRAPRVALVCLPPSSSALSCLGEKHCYPDDGGNAFI